MASTWAGSNRYLKPGMRGVPFMMVSRMTCSLPPAESFDSTGPNCCALICGLAWQTPQDWVTRRWPNCCCPVRDCADTYETEAESNNAAKPARLNIGRPPKDFA